MIKLRLNEEYTSYDMQDGGKGYDLKYVLNGIKSATGSKCTRGNWKVECDSPDNREHWTLSHKYDGKFKPIARYDSGILQRTSPVLTDEQYEAITSAVRKVYKKCK